MAQPTAGAGSSSSAPAPPAPEESPAPSAPERQWHPLDPVSHVYVRFKGLKALQPQVLVGECSALRYARNLQDVHYALQHSTARLQELGVLKSLRADVSLEPPGVVDIVWEAEERRRQLTVGGSVDQKGEVVVDAKVEQPILFGRPLAASASARVSASAAHDFQLRLQTPRFLGRRCTSSIEVARLVVDETQASSYGERADHLTWRAASASGDHAVTVDVASRELLPADGFGLGGGGGFLAPSLRRPSLEVMEAKQHSMKTSVKYSFEAAWRLSGLLAPWLSPSSSSSSSPALEPCHARLRCSLEAAGLLGDVGFLRGEIAANAGGPLPLPRPLPRGVEWSATASLGLLRPTDGGASCLQDRFFLGGASGSATIVKGFAHRGLGPVGLCAPAEAGGASPSASSSKRGASSSAVGSGSSGALRVADSLGGDAMASAFLAVSAPLPAAGVSASASDGDDDAAPADGSGLRVFGFVGCGGLCESSRGPPRELANRLLGSLRGSVGIGLGMPFSVGGLVELTFARPLNARSHDVRQPWQVGLRVESGA
eukprot:TRINITY_DN4448_c0_g1_i2.p1 TRINITY_DN4448_c0_g1~~TRINITY_DN4448_c0_g1_i2.p1  ORF type:complete len:588 (+),score=123.84 TRINITY_DN4448_c0_g1_i2:135-1766(+)